MTSPAKIEANRRNAKRSTGPRSAAGKARVARNAYQHGLSLPISDDQSVREVAEWMDALKLEFDAAWHPELLLRAAEGQIELQRARRLKADLLNQEAKRAAATALPLAERVAEAFDRKAGTLTAFDRYEARALSKRRGALRKLSALKSRDAIPEEQGGSHGLASEPTKCRSDWID
jgi:hypothetical protein